MTDRLGRAVETVREVPAVGQASLAHTILRLAETGKPLDIEPGYRGAVIERATQAA
ncbi:hypothetical protein [Methylobacterium haplocladii]|nr:hypothetical protein [Methylobacterium haplocladii]